MEGDLPASPVLITPAGSINRTDASSSARGQCSTPRGTTNRQHRGDDTHFVGFEDLLPNYFGDAGGTIGDGVVGDDQDALCRHLSSCLYGDLNEKKASGTTGSALEAHATAATTSRTNATSAAIVRSRWPLTQRVRSRSTSAADRPESGSTRRR